ncbi:hypothetical protein SELMODRAFT_402039 [Selaginella moellendorffii]|uniref:Uncharacterized protein n=1 Tax=Selaginella moellendorffii TaxID=88036 RepID=D8QPE2_SELML|nr:hypothetical protein SELMODRAFT_402039 [Selaginella moellendorffii]
MELEVIRQLAVSAGLGDGRSEQTPIVIRGSRAGGFASGDIDRIIEAAIEKALSKRQKTTLLCCDRQKKRKKAMPTTTFEARWRSQARTRDKEMDDKGSASSSDKPSYSFRTSDTAALSWSSLAFVMELKYELTKLNTECLGETTARLDVIKMTQSSRRFAYAVLLCRQEIQVQKLDMVNGKNQYTFTQRYPWALKKGPFRLRLLVGILLADGTVYGFSPPQMHGRISLELSSGFENRCSPRSQA